MHRIVRERSVVISIWLEHGVLGGAMAGVKTGRAWITETEYSLFCRIGSIISAFEHPNKLESNIMSLWSRDCSGDNPVGEEGRRLRIDRVHT